MTSSTLNNKKELKIETEVKGKYYTLEEFKNLWKNKDGFIIDKYSD